MFTGFPSLAPVARFAARAALVRSEFTLRSFSARKKSKPKGVIVTATVFGDLHEIGKNLVGMMLEGASFKVVDLGVNVKAEMIIETAKKG